MSAFDRQRCDFCVDFIENLSSRKSVAVYVGLLEFREVGATSFPEVEANYVIRDGLSGQSRALAVACSGVADAPDKAVRCVVKLPSRLSGRAPLVYLVEAVGSLLARRLAITTPRPYAVRITDAIARSVAPSIKVDFQQSIGVVFGSEFQGPPFVPWTMGRLLPSELRQAAAEVLAFDVFIHNVDRRKTNPNLLATRDQVLAFDHGECFSFILPTFGAPPPEEDPLNDVLDKHVFTGLFGRKLPSLDEFRERVCGLDDADFDALPSLVPVEWQQGTAAGKIERIIEVLKKRRDCIDRWLPKV